jgi:hypothetical protein
MTGEYLWWIDNDSLVIGLDNGDGTYTAPAVDGNAIRAYCTRFPDALTNSTGSHLTQIPLPEQFHMAIIDGAIADGYLLPGGVPGMYSLFEQKYLKGVVDGQVYASRQRSGDWARPKKCNLFEVEA